MGFFGPMGWFGSGFSWIVILMIVICAFLMLGRGCGSRRWFPGGFKSEAKPKSALDILKQRYAKGEIDKKEFDEKKKDLS